MQTAEFHELAGRIEALVHVLGLTIGRLHTEGVVDGPELADAIGQRGRDICFDRPHLAATQRTLQEFSAALEASVRQ